MMSGEAREWVVRSRWAAVLAASALVAMGASYPAVAAGKV